MLRSRSYTSKEDLIGILVVAVVNFSSKQIADSISEVLVLGVETKKRGCGIAQA